MQIADIKWIGHACDICAPCIRVRGSVKDK